MTSPSRKLLFPQKIWFHFLLVLLYSPRLMKVNVIEIAVYSPLRNINSGNSFWDIFMAGC